MPTYERQVMQTVNIPNDALEIRVRLEEKAGEAQKQLLAMMAVEVEGAGAESGTAWLSDVSGLDVDGFKADLVKIRDHILAAKGLTQV